MKLYNIRYGVKKFITKDMELKIRTVARKS